MTDSLEKIAKMATKEAVSETFLTLGLDIKDPVSVQGQFASLRNLYYGTRHVRNVIIAAGISSLVGGLAWALWTGIKVGAALAGK